MSDKPLTAQQKLAVDCRNTSLIVSAAAGSGKTFVLARRVIELLSDPNDPCDVDRLLVLTFTNAAAAEMRQRIGSALHERLLLSGGNAHLRRQLALLGGSRIQTVHGFCQSLIREHFSRCGVDPDFRLADEPQCALLQQNALDAVMERAYEADDEDFRQLCGILSDDRSDEKLSKTVLGLYQKMRSHPHPDRLLELMPGLCAADLEDSGYSREMLRQARGLADFAHGIALSAREEVAAVPQVEEKYALALDSCVQGTLRLLEAIDEGWESARACIGSLCFEDLKSCRYEDKAFLERIKARRDLVKKQIGYLKQYYFSMSPETMARDGARQASAVRALCRLVTDFTAEYDGQKRRLGVLDFSDLEHMALHLLQNGDGTPSDIAEELTEHFREIIVDEYQDTNEIQEEIFRTLRRKGDSAFFVGDVKQSIYRFRLADPTVFLDRCAVSEQYDGTDGGDRRLSLNTNFRSRPEVLELCNYVFSRLMSSRFGDVEYDEEQRLNPHRDQRGIVPSEVLLLDTTDSGDPEEDEPESEDEKEERRLEKEARLAALRIKRLLREETVPEDGGDRPARPEDVAILLSAFRGKAEVFRQALLREGIPCSGGSSAFFGTIETAVILSLLRLLQNRRQDIPLVSALRSPLYLFSADDLARLRLKKENVDLIECVAAAAEDGDARCAAFLADLDRWDQAALELPLTRLIRLIYDETGAEGVFAAMDGGKARVRNLRKIERLAGGFDSSITGGLSAFLRWIDRKLEEGSDPEDSGSESEGVQLMTIHRSKGLEFPFVILADLARQFNEEDLRKDVLFHPSMGVGMRLPDETIGAKVPTWQWNAVKLRTQAEMRSEELRKLYVAMTRAREKLILILAENKLENKVKKIADGTAGAPAPVWLSLQSNMMNWLLAALISHPAAGALRELCGFVPPVGADAAKENLIVRLVSLPEEKAGQEPAVQPEAAGAAAEGEDASRFAPYLAKSEEEYAHLAASRLPSKLTPTGLRKLIPEAGEIFGRSEKPIVRDHREAGVRRTDPAATQRGTAMHVLLRYADFSDCADADAVRRQAKALVENGRLTKEEEKLIIPELVVAFASSELAKRMKRASRVLREYEFGVLLDAASLLKDGPADEQILLNGAIDLLLFEESGLTVVDFKTDRVVPGGEREKAEEHRLQLELYARAAEQVFGLPVREKWVWFLRQGTGVLLS